MKSHVTTHVALAAILCMSLTAGRLGAQALDDPHVFVTDVINANCATTINKADASSVKEWSYVGGGATYAAKSSAARSNNPTYFSLYTSAKPSALVTTASKGTVCKVTLCWMGGGCTSGVSTLKVFGKDTPYTSYTDALSGDVSTRGEELSSKVYLSSDPREQTFTLDSPCRYVAFAASGATAGLQYLHLTWQLAYYREGITSGALGTLCLPYDVVAEDLDGLKVYEVEGRLLDANGTTTAIVFVEAEEMAAGKPYVFVAESNEIALQYAHESSYVEAAGSHHGLYGTMADRMFSEAEVATGDYYVLTGFDTVQAVGANSGVRANRAYMKMSEIPVIEHYESSQSGRLTISLQGNIATSAAPAMKGEEQSAVAYDLSGRRCKEIGVGQNALKVMNGRKILKQGL